MRQKIEIEVEVPEGFELTGEYRVANKGEHFIKSDKAYKSDGIFVERYPILRKKPKRYLVLEIVEGCYIAQQGEFTQNNCGLTKVILDAPQRSTNPILRDVTDRVIVTEKEAAGE